MSVPTYMPLLNSIAVNEAKGEILLQTWANATKDASLKSVLQFVAIREGEHSKAFAKRMCELGCPVDEASAYKVFKDFDGLIACVSSDATDAEKVAMLSGGNRSEGERAERKDPFRGFFNDTTIDPQTGELLGRYIAEERDSGRRLQAEYDRVCAASGMNGTASKNEIAELTACIESLRSEVSALKKAVRKAAA